MLLRLLFLFLFFSVVGRAKPVELEKSTSPDGKYFITLEASADDPDSGFGMLQIRSTKTKRIVGAFSWGQFFPHLTTDSGQVLWKSDGCAFAINSLKTRGCSGCQVYALNRDRWIQLSVPNFKRIDNHQDGWTGNGKGGYTASSWLSKNVLKMEYEEGFYWSLKTPEPTNGPVGDYWIYLRLLQGSQGPYLDVWSVNEKSMQVN